MEEHSKDRSGEWFVPSIGSPAFRKGIGLLFLPYTGMVLAFTVIGSMLADPIYWDRVAAIMVIYFLALGIGAHALDALGSGGIKPWGTVFSPTSLWIWAIGSILVAYSIGIYYMWWFTPLLWCIAIPEGFFLLAYNLEWFHGRFHNDFWFAVSWGALPVLAGYIIQTNRLSVAALLISIAMGLLSLVEIKASRPYKELIRSQEALTSSERIEHIRQYEAILKSISLGVIFLGFGFMCWRLLV